MYYFVFAQGWVGQDSGPNRGGVTSFGGYLSVNGGDGGVDGPGRMGFTHSGWYLIRSTNNIQVTVGAGGVCVISWSTPPPKPKEVQCEKI
ncbi:hypothetical protein ASB1_11300 [Helicobacter heilmannii]|nr:hypothetical protein ASB1_11300 [Helicobacter heilmannii]